MLTFNKLDHAPICPLQVTAGSGMWIRLKLDWEQDYAYVVTIQYGA